MLMTAKLLRYLFIALAIVVAVGVLSFIGFAVCFFWQLSASKGFGPG